MVIFFSKQWDSNVFFRGTIAFDGFAIESFPPDWPLRSMVFQWFSQNLKKVLMQIVNFAPKLVKPGWTPAPMTMWSCFDQALGSYLWNWGEGCGYLLLKWGGGVVILQIKSRMMRPISSSTQIPAGHHHCAGFLTFYILGTPSKMSVLSPIDEWYLN